MILLIQDGLLQLIQPYDRSFTVLGEERSLSRSFVQHYSLAEQRATSPFSCSPRQAKSSERCPRHSKRIHHTAQTNSVLLARQELQKRCPRRASCTTERDARILHKQWLPRIANTCTSNASLARRKTDRDAQCTSRNPDTVATARHKPTRHAGAIGEGYKPAP